MERQERPSAGTSSRLLPLVLLASLALGAGCHGAGDHNRVAVEPQRAVTSSGLVVIDLLPGVGAAAARGDRVRVEYAIELADGTKVDSSRDRGNPLEYVLGDAPLAALDEGVLGMRQGGRRRLIAPPELGYGAGGVPGLVPPDAQLTLLVDLLALLPSDAR